MEARPPGWLDSRRQDIYSIMKERFTDETNPCAFVSFSLATTQLTCYDETARIVLDTPIMDASACSWPNYFATQGCTQEDTKRQVMSSAIACGEARASLQAEAVETSELLIRLITKLGRVKVTMTFSVLVTHLLQTIYMRFVNMRDQHGVPAECLCWLWDVTNKPIPPNLSGGYTLGHDEHQLCPLPMMPVSSNSAPDIVVRIRKARTMDDIARMQQAPFKEESRSGSLDEGTETELVPRAASDQDWHQYCHTWDWTKVRRVTNMHEKTTQRKRRRKPGQVEVITLDPLPLQPEATSRGSSGSSSGGSP